ncbi:hypothetical protein LKL35_36455 [Streptomyces sp. ET3-23]|uniref:hypothetical protein n=1 Tax=Streptomyces sp. ET3-23 TaxID=2885643 RepID=UPI001D109282|nr:hypothetical protein [Streptomyces sp. ET3-23]MCC2280826.1 hypothetical protein [Streptomyces sp. ET3-23]
MVAIAGTLNTAYGSNEHARALKTLDAQEPTAKLGWPYSFDPVNNTIARRRQASVPALSRKPAQDLDHVLLRRGHALPSRWNSRVLVTRTPWRSGTRLYTDYSDHQPVMAGAGVSTRPGRYDLIITAVRVITHDGTRPHPWGTLTVTTDTGGPTLIWERVPSHSHAQHPGTNLVHHPLLFSSSTAFAIQVDLSHGDSNHPGQDATLAYGTLWWQAGTRLGRHITTIAGSTGQATVSFTTQLASTQLLSAYM